MSKGTKILMGVVIVAAIAGVGFANLKKSAASGKAEEVRLEKVEKRTLTSTVRSPGRVQPAEYVNLSAQIPGRVVELAVKEGDTVSAGQLLLRLDDTQYRAAVESARASVKSAEASVTLAEARVERSQQNVERQRKMAEQKMVSPEAIEIAETDLKVNQAELAARREEKSRAEAQVKSALDDLSKTVYTAPTAGVITDLNVKQGEIVITGTMNNPGTVILTIADRSRMQVEADVDETDVVDIRPGQEALITVDALPDTTFKGVVTEIATSAQLAAQASAEAATNFQVKVLFSDNVPQLRPGMTADVEITTKVRNDALTVPISALVARDRKTIESQKKMHEDKLAGKGAAKAKKSNKKGDDGDDDATLAAASSGPREKLLEGVFINKDGHALFVPVKTGASDDTHIEITGDLSIGQEIVTGPYKTLRELKYGAAIKKMKKGGGGEKKKSA